MYRIKKGVLEFFLVHPGGPFFAWKDAGAWSIPKGEIEEKEDALSAARREFKEETGFSAEGTFLPLKPVRQKSGKLVHAWAVEGDCDPEKIKSNLFTMPWPRHSKAVRTFREVDRAGWFSMEEAQERINPAQFTLLEELRQKLSLSAKISS